MPFVHLDLGFTKGLGEVILRGTLAWASPFHRQAQTEPWPSGALSPNPQPRDTWNSDAGNILQSNRAISAHFPQTEESDAQKSREEVNTSHPAVWQEVNHTCNTWTHPPWQGIPLLGEGHLCLLSSSTCCLSGPFSSRGLYCSFACPSDMFLGTFWTNGLTPC